MTEELQGISAQLMERIKEHAGLAITAGVVILIMGVVALSTPMITGISVAMVVGIVMIVSGIAQLFFAYKSGQGFWSYLMGLLTIVAGGYMAANPDVAVVTLVIFLAAYLFATGVSEIIHSFQMKPIRGWGWTLFSGILSVLLGLMIWGQFPLGGVMAIGILLGFKLVFSGMSLITLGLAARKAT